MLVEYLPLWLQNLLGPDAVFWVGYLTNGKHLGWYASVQYTLIAAVFGALVALLLGLAAAAARTGPLPVRLVASGYINVVRGVPDVLFFLFFPLAFQQAVEFLWSTQVCTPETLAANVGHWPPCPAAKWRISNFEYLVLACVSLGIVYGAFVGNVISGALRSVPSGQLEAARAYGMTRFQVLRRVHVRQMWVYALPGLSNVWMSLLKATSLLSLLQITDFVTWAQRLGAANMSRAAGLVHDDWRWRYYLVLLLFYILLTFVSEKIFVAISARVRRGMPIANQDAA
jgi:polar amino acid transport system permease protein